MLKNLTRFTAQLSGAHTEVLSMTTHNTIQGKCTHAYLNALPGMEREAESLRAHTDERYLYDPEYSPPRA
jgi:hypothetical protein